MKQVSRASPGVSGETGAGQDNGSYASAELASRLVWRWLPPAVAVLGLALLAVYRLSEMGSLPTGVDGGNWLAIGRAFPAEGDLPNGGAYPPLVPVTARLLSVPLEPQEGIRLLAIASVLAVVAAILVVGWKEAGWWPAMLAAAVVALGRPVNEPLAFGGYPQNFALAGCLLALWLLAAAAIRPAIKTIVPAAAAFVAVALSHHAYFLFASASAAILLVLLALAGGWWRRPFGHGRGWLALPLAAGMLAFAPTFLALQRSGYEPAINVSQTSLVGALEYSFRGAEWLWVSLWAAALIGPILALRSRSFPAHSPLALAMTAMVVTATGAFAVTAEPRLLPAIAVAAPISCAAWIGAWREQISPQWMTVLVAAPISVLIFAFPAQDRVMRDDFAYYRVIDRDFVAAAKWADAHPTGGVTAVRADAREWPVGWWWRGLTDSPAMVGSNPKWLSFEAERGEAAAVAQIFGQPTPGGAVRLARRQGVTRLVAPAHDWIGWQQWLEQGDDGLSLAYCNESIVILDVSETR